MIYVILGTTASGKTDFSIDLAKETNAEIINTDSVQFYKKLNIGSNKITKEEMQGVKHHLIDFLEPFDSNYSIADFQKDGRAVIQTLLNEDKNIIIVGGSSLYIKALLFDYEFREYSKEEKDNIEEMRKKYTEYDIDTIYDKLIKVDPLSEEKIHKNNKKRVVNAYIYYKLNKSSIHNQTNGSNLIYSNVEFLGVKKDKDKLNEDIKLRTKLMFKKGLIDEVKQFEEKWKSQEAIGYSEVHDYLNGKINLEECIELVEIHTRQLAKRQRTFLNNEFANININWYNIN